jgi:type II secretion system protein N
VQISKKVAGSDDKPPESLAVKSVALRPSLFPLGIAFRARIFGGTITGALGGIGDVSLRLNLNNLDPGDPGFRTFSGLDMSGKINGSLSLEIPKSGPPAAKVQEPDLSRAGGTLTLNSEQLLVKGGTLTVPVYGEMTPIDLPKIALGAVEVKIKFEKGLGTIESFQSKGEDLDLSATGTLKLAKRIDYSEANVAIKLKAEPGFTNRLGMIAMGLSTLPADNENPSFKLARMTGFLGRLDFNPGR